MQRILPLLGLLLVFACSPEDNINGIETIANTDMIEESESSNIPEGPVFDDRNKETILTYFESLIANEQLIVGQQCGDAPDSTWWYYNTYVDQLADETGRHVGLIGADFGWFEGDNYPVQTLIDHWREGGLVTVSWHADNPFVDAVDVYWDTVNDSDQINLKSLLKDQSQTKAWTSYRTELDKVAGALQKLRDAGVTVIWRPFHEMNGDFFWWGTNANGNQQTNEADYKALWIDLYNTFRWDYGLDNLIWTYSVVPSETWYAAVTAYYPGDDYVDLVGMDYYGNQPDFPHYEELKALGKPIVMSESGPREAGYGNWDMMEFASLLKGKVAYFLQWHSWNGAKVAIKDNKNFIEMMNSKAVITRGEILPTSF
ncbi:glycosyl hydrolase [Maribacter sp. 2308TA10-17]|uniref:glycosyl hydrolase n=1 Tax=Maribacter sp. 2308TA10-17 TaxID=3386276 RepID=UPI0039BD402E